MLSLLILSAILYLLYGDMRILSVVLVSFTGFLIGLYDDLKGLSGVSKALLLLLPGALLVLTGSYFPRPILPFIGPTRLTILYPILLILASTIVANGVNMLDIFNGLVTSVMITVTLPLLIAFLLKGDTVMFSMGLLYVGVLLGFLLRHRYPSRIFPGDSGAMLMGLVYLGLLIEGREEVIGIVAMLPMILNGFFIVSTIGGFIEHKDIPKRPTTLVEGHKIKGVGDADAPLTLSRLITLRTALSEKELVFNIWLLFLFSSLLALLTLLIMRWWV
jgi:UDP-N-acetylglucosamine--dolichyl-phosphate N-acetylglucosaminephosphotransferase